MFQAHWKKMCPPMHHTVATQTAMGEQAFPTFPCNSWRTVYLRNKKSARQEGWACSTFCDGRFTLVAVQHFLHWEKLWLAQPCQLGQGGKINAWARGRKPFTGAKGSPFFSYKRLLQFIWLEVWFQIELALRSRSILKSRVWKRGLEVYGWVHHVLQ